MAILSQSREQHCRTLPVLLFFLMIVFACPPAAAAKDLETAEPPIIAGAEIDYPPFSFVDAEGRPAGFSIELLQAALKAVGRDVEFRTGIWADVRGWLERGDIDALPLVGRTPERERLFDFTFPYMTRNGAIVVRTDAPDIRNLDDLKGRTVAVMRGDNAEEFLRRKDRGIAIQQAATYHEALKQLSAGRYDAVVMQRLVALRLIQESGIENLRVVRQTVAGLRQNFCFAVRDGDWKTLALLNDGLALVTADGTFRRLYAKWFAALELPSRPIVIGGDRNYPPYEYIDENGRPAGYNVDLTRAIALELGLDIEIRLGPWAEIQAALARGEIDAVEGMFYSPRRDITFDFTPPYTVNHYVGVVRKNGFSPPATREALAGRRIVVQEGDLMQEWTVENGLGDHVSVVGSQEEALRGVMLGRYDCALVSRLTALFYIKKNGWSRLTVGRRPILSPEYCYAVAQNHKALLAELGEGLRLVEENGQYRRINEKWMGVYADPHPRVTKTIRYIALAAIPLTLILLGFFLWSWSLRKQVSLRTADLEQSEQRIKHLNNVLRAIRDINQLIVRERDPDRLLLEGCRLLVDNRGYASALIVRTDENDRPVSWAVMGASPCSRTLDCLPEDGGLPPCCDLACAKNEVAFIGNREEICGRCPYADRQEDGSIQLLCVRLAYERTVFGYLVVELHHDLGADDEELRLFTEMARDLAHALMVLKKDEAHKKARIEGRSLKRQLLQAQKLESVGRLAGGVAHDYNNMLSVITGYAELALDGMDAKNPLHGCITEILRAAKRSTEITKQLLAFARRQTVAPKVLDLNETVEGMLKMLRRLIGENIALAWHPKIGLWPVKIDPSQVDQILANLCINARDAIGDIGKITIETDMTVFNEDYRGDPPESAPGEYVMLAVSDDGAGMNKEIAERIFEPFFTTKEAHRGTGLGLATVYGIVKQNRGFINVYSEPGKGTTFRIYLARYTGDIGEERSKADVVEEGRGETVLVVEDDVSILKLTGTILNALNYRVLLAKSPAEALQRAKENPGGISLLITDVVMPEMNGRTLAGRLQTLYPGLKCLFMSGYTANVIAHQGVLDEDVHFIQKPFSKTELAAKIRSALAG